MYKISVPILLENIVKYGKREKILDELKRIGAERVVLGLGAFCFDKDERDKEMAAIEENCSYFKKHGFEVCAWVWAFMCNGKGDFTKLTDAYGNIHAISSCPLDTDFKKFVGEYINSHF